jgi:hypothetical protein
VDVLITVAALGEARNESYIATYSSPDLFKNFVNYIADQFGVKRSGPVPLILAKAVVGSDIIKMLTRSAKATNEKIKRIYDFQYPSYREGIPDIVAKFNSTENQYFDFLIVATHEGSMAGVKIRNQPASEALITT